MGHCQAWFGKFKHLILKRAELGCHVDHVSTFVCQDPNITWICCHSEHIISTPSILYKLSSWVKFSLGFRLRYPPSACKWSSVASLMARWCHMHLFTSSCSPERFQAMAYMWYFISSSPLFSPLYDLIIFLLFLGRRIDSGSLKNSIFF
jgi:hypothetical protein